MFEAAGLEGLLVQRFEYFRRVECILIIKIIDLHPEAIGKQQIVSEAHKQVAVRLRHP